MEKKHMGKIAKWIWHVAGVLFAVGYLFSFNPISVQATEVPTENDEYTVTDAQFGAKGDDMKADAEAIQKALDKARITSETITVYIPDGTYYLDKYLIIYSNTRLVLADNALIKRSENYCSMMLINGADDVDVLRTSTIGGYGQCSNIVIEGGTWDGTITGEVTKYDNLLYFGHADGVTVKNTTIMNVYGVHQLELTGVKNATVTNVNFSGFYASDDENADRFKEALQIDRITKEGSWWYAPHDSTPCQNITVENCSFDGTPCGVGSHSYEDGVYHTGITIKNNSFKNISNRLIVLPHFKDFRVEGNCITSDTTVNNVISIDVVGSTGTIKNNTIGMGTEHGIYMMSDSDVTISDNKVTDTVLSAIRVNGSTARIQGNIISKTTKDAGIKAAEGSSVQIIGNTLSDCAITLIATKNVNGAVIKDNILKDATSSNGISIDSSAAGTKITDNTITNVGEYPVFVYGSSGTIVMGNVLEGFTEYGVYIRESVDGTVRANGITISQNKIRGGTAGIGIRNADNTAVVKNKISDASICAIYVANTCKNTSIKENVSPNAFLIYDNTAYLSGNEAGKSGLAKDENGIWYYYTNGKIDTSVTNLIYYNGSYYYVEKGKLNWDYTSLFLYKGNWYYVEKGKVNFGVTTLCKYNGSWWYVRNGSVDFSATTLCKYNGSWWYVRNGSVDFSATTLCKYDGKWYYVNKGVVDFSYSGPVVYNGKTYTVKNGVMV